MAANENPFALFGVEQVKRGRKAGEDETTAKNNAAVVTLSKSAKVKGNLKGFVLTQSHIVKADGKSVGYDTVRNYAKTFCENNSGWSIVGKVKDGENFGVLITRKK